MKFLIVFIGSVFLSQVSAASWFNFRDENSPSDVLEALPVSDQTYQQCLRLADWGQCSFYDCLEAKFPCGDNGYTKKISKHFCSKIDAEFDRFDAFGKRWLNRTSICLLTYMKPIYESSSTSCQDIKNSGIDAILNCNDGEVDGQDFCDFLASNGDAYNSLMGMEEVQLMLSLRDARVFRSMITDAITCGVSTLGDKARSAGQYISDLFNRFTSYFWN